MTAVAVHLQIDGDAGNTSFWACWHRFCVGRLGRTRAARLGTLTRLWRWLGDSARAKPALFSRHLAHSPVFWRTPNAVWRSHSLSPPDASARGREDFFLARCDFVLKFVLLSHRPNRNLLSEFTYPAYCAHIEQPAGHLAPGLSFDFQVRTCAAARALLCETTLLPTKKKA